MKRILTGDRPTSGSFHLGNYVGSLKNRVNLQDEYETYILVADLHALTTHFNKTETIRENIKGLMLGYLSIGSNPIDRYPNIRPLIFSRIVSVLLKWVVRACRSATNMYVSYSSCRLTLFFKEPT